MISRVLLAPAIVLATSSGALAAGLVIPEEPDLPPMALTSHVVRVEIEGQAASTAVEQTFANNTQRRLEAQYVFPVPEGAAVSGFVMQLDGRELGGEIVREERAREIYQSVIRRSGDAGLLEYIGNDVFRTSLFPVEPGRPVRIAVRFQQVLAAESGLVHYVYPMRDGPRRGPTVHGEFRLEAVIRSATPIRNVYSPSHDVVVERSREREARVTFGVEDTTLMKDFHLYYGVSDQDVGLDLLTYRPDGAPEGYFLMAISPRSRLQAERVVERDIVFVVDTSGSMEGDKIRQARNALRYAITNLNDGDRFGLVRFSTDVYPWNERFVAATSENRSLALTWVDGLGARGGTDIAGALDRSLSFPRDPARPCFVIFLTDGRPTIGTTIEPPKILANVRDAASPSRGTTVRVFTWGVGYDVDPQLLDSIASSTGGVSEYVRPEEDIAAKVTAFYNRTSHPVLTDMKLEVEGGAVELLDLHPRTVPDLYAGTQVVLLGRYTGDGEVALRLEGRVNDETERFDYRAVFPRSDARREFVELLWARRRIGYLLDSIREQGEERELVDEAIRLSMHYGIQTPYTSYLILDDGQVASATSPSSQAARRGTRALLARRDRAVDAVRLRFARNRRELDALAGEAVAEEQRRGESLSLAAVSAGARRKQNALAENLAQGFESRAGRAAVETATYLRRLKEAEREDRGAIAPFRRAAGTRFYSYRGLWVDERFRASDAVTVVRFASPAYFRLIERHPELIRALRVSRALIYVTAPGKALVVAATGAERLGDEEMAELFR